MAINKCFFFIYTKIYGHFPSGEIMAIDEVTVLPKVAIRQGSIVFIVNIVFIHWNVYIGMKMVIFFIFSIKSG